MVKAEHKIQSEPSKAMPPTSSSCKKKYKGVRMRSWGSWVSEIRAPNQKTRIWLGSYSTAEAAARAYDAALLCLKGASANLNFPICPSQYLPTDTIMSPKSVQRVAAAAANCFTDNATPPTPPLCPPSFSTSSSSTSSPSNAIEEDASLVQSFGPDDLLSITAPWYNFDSPKYTEMLNGLLFDLPMIEDICEEGDIRLWSFWSRQEM